MIKGKIDSDLVGYYDSIILVVDIDLLFTVITGKLTRRKNYSINSFNRQLIQYLVTPENSSKYDEIIIAIVDNYDYCKHIVDDILRVPFSSINLGSESNLEQWLKLINPVAYLTTNKRRYYYKKSILVEPVIINNELSLNETLLP